MPQETHSECKVDRTGWPSGPWDSEPDRLDFIHAGFSCLLLRSHVGAWCGYVGVPETHPAFGKDYDDVEVEVHGGLTYMGLCRESICHVPIPGMPEKVWWLGFDMIHSHDYAPGLFRNSQLFEMFGDSGSPKGIYHNINDAQAEVCKLAEQLRKL